MTGVLVQYFVLLEWLEIPITLCIWNPKICL